MRVHTRTRRLVVALGILALAPGMLWAAVAPQSPPSGPADNYYSGPKELRASSEAYEDGPIQHPPGPVFGGNQSVAAGHAMNPNSAFGSDGRLGGSNNMSATGAAAASKTDTVEKNLRRLAGRLR